MFFVLGRMKYVQTPGFVQEIKEVPEHVGEMRVVSGFNNNRTFVFW
jgi:hypothetical protein